ncbi:DMT family transporter [Lacibacter sediminis]|uniref:DMT family transporter n=1 Tax=Lacibacter sediminis TaxID=2760713 RepID=A0A7G5XL81_9BACT|nr:DMT family transporter [Lacibacter sediminis]QNA46234.1 DMT family transporter [Lacibacter sediminis]
MNWKYIAAGVFFALLWSSAATATKISLQSAQPFVIAVARFFIGGVGMLVFAHLIWRKRFPKKKEWLFITVYGLLNISLYLGLYVVAMQEVSAGLGSMAVAVNPVLISILSAALFDHKMGTKHWLSLLLCSAGVVVAAWPLLQNSFATVNGILIMLVSMLAYSAGAIYFARAKWSDLHILTINGWQTLIGGVLLIPVLLFTYKSEFNHFDFHFYSGVLWLAIPVSIAAVQLWLWLLKRNAVTASYWLFLCPVFGFIIAAVSLNEPITLFTVAGVLLVTAGLYMVQKNIAAKRKN